MQYEVHIFNLSCKYLIKEWADKTMTMTKYAEVIVQ